jgi:AraC-like DNA-binding protein
MQQSPRLRRYPLVQTSLPGELENALVRACGAEKLALLRPFGTLAAEVNHIRLGDVALAYCFCSAPARVRFAASADFRLQFALNGSGTTICHGKRLPISPKEICIIPPGTASEADFASGFEQLVMTIDAGAVARKLGARIAGDPHGGPDFRDIGSAEQSTLQNLRRLVLFAAAELDADSPIPEPALAEIEQALIVSLLCATHRNFRSARAARPKSVAPWQVRLVEDYIRANWSQPLTIETLAAVTNASVRSIFNSFKRSRGYTPMAFMKKTRLEQTKLMLQAAGPKASVTGVAFACGFHSLGHFARDYHLAFGELPSATLDRARGPRRDLTCAGRDSRPEAEA